jgi:regulatory protein
MNSELQQHNKIIFNYACALLARRRYSISEFRRKLDKKFPDQQENTNQITELFLERKYLDDDEYVTLYIREQLRRKPQGLRLIKQKLRQKGINEATLSSIFKEQLIDEDVQIEQAVIKKLKTMQSNTSQEKKQKLFRFLASRGFNQESIMKAISKI